MMRQIDVCAKLSHRAKTRISDKCGRIMLGCPNTCPANDIGLTQQTPLAGPRCYT